MLEITECIEVEKYVRLSRAHVNMERFNLCICRGCVVIGEKKQLFHELYWIKMVVSENFVYFCHSYSMIIHGGYAYFNVCCHSIP